MDVISGLASASQLLAYSHSTFQVLIRLYKQVKDGPITLKQQQSSVRVLLTIVDSLHKRPAPAHILTTLLELSTLATEALNLITQSQRKGFLGLCWASVRNDPALSQVFASLKDKQELLHLAISIDTRQTFERIQDHSEIMSSSSGTPRKSWFSTLGYKILKTVKSNVSGDDNNYRVGNGEMRDGEMRQVKHTIKGNRNICDVGNTDARSAAEMRAVAETVPNAHYAPQSQLAGQHQPMALLQYSEPHRPYNHLGEQHDARSRPYEQQPNAAEAPGTISVSELSSPVSPDSSYTPDASSTPRTRQSHDGDDHQHVDSHA